MTWQQLVALHRQWHSLTKELKDAEQALGQDASEANYLRLRDVKARLSRVEGTEALLKASGPLPVGAFVAYDDPLPALGPGGAEVPDRRGIKVDSSGIFGLIGA